MRVIFLVFFLFFFSVSVFCAEVLFEVIDIDGEGHVGQISAISADSIQLKTSSNNLTFSPQRVEIVQNLSLNPFLLPNKSINNNSNNNNETDLDILKANQGRIQRIIVNGQEIIVNETGNIIQRSDLLRPNNFRRLPATLQKIRESENNKNSNPQQLTQKILQFPQSVIVIELLDGSRLVATKFIVKDQKAICNLLDQNYVVPAKEVDPKSGNKVVNKSEGENKEKFDVEKVNDVKSVVEVSFDQIFSVRFSVRGISDIYEPPVEWLKYVSESGTSGDRLVISKSGVFDIYSGIVSEVTQDSVMFSIDGDKLPIQRSKIYGMILHSPNREQVKRKTISNGQITFWTGTQLMLDSLVMRSSEAKTVTENFRNNNSDDDTNDKIAAKEVVDDKIVELSDGKIFWKALAGFSGESLLSEVDNIVFLRGNSLYFTDLVPVIRERLLPFEWGGVMSKSDNLSPVSKMKLFQAGRFGIGKNTSEKVDPSLEALVPLNPLGKKQIAKQPIPAIEGVILNGVLYRRGVMLSPKTTLEYIIADDEQSYSAIRGFVGIDDRLKPRGYAKLVIEVDGKLIDTVEVHGKDAAKLLRYELPKTHKKITITADFADNFTEYAPISIGDLKLIK
ncbi:MAG: NPCBM/NEW2 domain-containing protein [Planctomycetaceae bacterium]|jgi:hypothetical protein|nr:NPCBM/NEW2 domain-containing protein [Planctomycetaceae bacterium]